MQHAAREEQTCGGRWLLLANSRAQLFSRPICGTVTFIANVSTLCRKSHYVVHKGLLLYALLAETNPPGHKFFLV
jgi:hypothetical protein